MLQLLCNALSLICSLMEEEKCSTRGILFGFVWEMSFICTALGVFIRSLFENGLAKKEQNIRIYVGYSWNE